MDIKTARKIKKALMRPDLPDGVLVFARDGDGGAWYSRGCKIDRRRYYVVDTGLRRRSAAKIAELFSEDDD